MSTDTRNTLIDAYFAALDQADPELARDALTSDFVYESLAEDLEGFPGLKAYIEELRGVWDSDHEVDFRVHGEAGSAVEGTVTGESDTGPVEVDFCDVFEFDETTSGISRIAVYLNQGR